MSLRVSINSSPLLSIRCIIIFLGVRLSKVFNAKSFEEKLISDRYLELKFSSSIGIIFLSLSNKILSPPKINQMYNRNIRFRKRYIQF